MCLPPGHLAEEGEGGRGIEMREGGREQNGGELVDY